MGTVCVYKGAVNLDDLHDLRQDTENALKERGIDDDTCSNLVLMVDEWITNVVNYAYQNERGELELRVEVNSAQVSICIRDRGPEFDITSYKAVEVKNIYAPDSKPGGLGIELIRRLADKLEYSRSEDGWNESCFKKNI
ncbi:ATP-binding protein [Kaarinaea lacus]